MALESVDGRVHPSAAGLLPYLNSGSYAFPVRFLFLVQHPEQRQEPTRERHVLAAASIVPSRAVASTGNRIHLVTLIRPTRFAADQVLVVQSKLGQSG